VKTRGQRPRLATQASTTGYGICQKKGELEKAKKLNFGPNAKKAKGKEIVTTRRKQQIFFQSSKATTKKCVVGGELRVVFEAGTLAHNTPQTWPFVS
jgi:hypothetical protein